MTCTALLLVVVLRHVQTRPTESSDLGIARLAPEKTFYVDHHWTARRPVALLKSDNQFANPYKLQRQLEMISKIPGIAGALLDASERVTHSLVLYFVAVFNKQLYKMFRNNTKKRTVLKNFQTELQHSVSYPHRLNFYSFAPQNEITLEEFELWAIDRLYGS